jgi:hypothetical protein
MDTTTLTTTQPTTNRITPTIHINRRNIGNQHTQTIALTISNTLTTSTIQREINITTPSILITHTILHTTIGLTATTHKTTHTTTTLNTI